ncbi:MAG: hypothetical protein ACOC3T_05550, partial [Bacteroidota bacterium]
MNPEDNNIEQILRNYKERQKELNCINRTINIFNKNKSIEALLDEVAKTIPKGWQYPDNTVARITLGDNQFTSKEFKETPWGQHQDFETTDGISGNIEVYYTKKFPDLDEGPFLKEERSLINNLSFILSSAITKRKSKHLLFAHTERLKELKGINETAEILRDSQSLEEALSKICITLPKAWQYPEFTAVRITYDDKIFESNHFYATEWCLKQAFTSTSNKKGVIEVYYLKKFPDLDEGPFMKEERHLLNNIAGLIAGTATSYDFKYLISENTERIKELDGLNMTSAIIAESLPIEETMQEICNILPKAWQYPDFTTARIIYDNTVYLSQNFTETEWAQRKDFITVDNKKGSIEVFYTQ